MDAPLRVALMEPDRKARLLLASSQASPPSSHASFQKATANLTDSTVSLLLMATVLPSFSTSLPPHDHMNGYQGGRVAEGVTGRLADRVALGLELLAELAVLLPGLGELLGAHL